MHKHAHKKWDVAKETTCGVDIRDFREFLPSIGGTGGTSNGSPRGSVIISCRKHVSYPSFGKRNIIFKIAFSHFHPIVQEGKLNKS